jgi:polysaccharide biosynthesis/export protein
MKKLLAAIVITMWLTHLNAWGEQQLRQRPVYTLHVGDEIALNYRFTPEFNQTVTVQPDGNVVLDVVGAVRVSGLTLEQAHDEIVKLASVQLNKPELSITLTRFEQPYVVVAGEVDRPGKIDMRQNTTALQAIMLAGGFKDSAKDTKVILFRRINGDMAEVRPLNLHNIKKHADLERDTELEPGDMLLVTRNKLEHLSRFMKASNIGLYFNPLTGLP